MKFFSAFLFTFATVQVLGQTNYDVSKIDESLKKDAAIIIRSEEQLLDIKSPSSAKYEYKIAATIFNKAGDYFANMTEVYDRFSEISNIKATLYDANGKKVKDYKSSDIKDESLVSGYSIFEDNRVKGLTFVSNTYPYTIEYSYTQDFKGLLFFPTWRDIKDFGISVEKSTYTIQKNKNYNFRFKSSKDLKTDSLQVGDKVQYKWSSTNKPALLKEPMNAGIDNVSSWVKASPNVFEYDGSNGNFDTWKNFGQWIHNLNVGGNTLSAPFKAKIQALTQNAKTQEEKVKILYNFLQQNTRYVSVQLGIGGFRPILAEKVAAVNYGDCKALSNYMKAMLNEVGIPSNLIVIGNDMPSLDPQYSSMGQANHMILAVPSAKDTMFLECTSQFYPMGFVGYGSANRDVLMVTDQGGKIVKTPKYSSQQNYQIRKSQIALQSPTEADITIKTIYGNAQFEDQLKVSLLEPLEQKKFILETSPIQIAEFGSYKCEQKDKTKAEIDEELSFKANSLLSKGGDKFFLLLNPINKKESVPMKIEGRKTYFSVPYAYYDTDEIVFKLPKGFKVDFLPKDIVIESEFGTYSATFSNKDDEITYVRKQEMSDKKYPPEKYNEYVDFYKKIVQADKQKAVLTQSL